MDDEDSEECEVLTYQAFRERETLLAWHARLRAYEEQHGPCSHSGPSSRGFLFSAPAGGVGVAPGSAQAVRITDRRALASPSFTT